MTVAGFRSPRSKASRQLYTAPAVAWVRFRTRHRTDPAAAGTPTSPLPTARTSVAFPAADRLQPGDLLHLGVEQHEDAAGELHVAHPGLRPALAVGGGCQARSSGLRPAASPPCSRSPAGQPRRHEATEDVGIRVVCGESTTTPNSEDRKSGAGRRALMVTILMGVRIAKSAAAEWGRPLASPPAPFPRGRSVGPATGIRRCASRPRRSPVLEGLPRRGSGTRSVAVPTPA